MESDVKEVWRNKSVSGIGKVLVEQFSYTSKSGFSLKKVRAVSKEGSFSKINMAYLNNLSRTQKAIPHLKVVIENPKGSYKSFETEGDPVWSQYPLKGVTYPVDYGYIEGYKGEDGAELDVFQGSGDLFGYITIWRADVPQETKFFVQLTPLELSEVLKVFGPVIVNHELLNEEQVLEKLTQFKI